MVMQELPFEGYFTDTSFQGDDALAGFKEEPKWWPDRAKTIRWKRPPEIVENPNLFTNAVRATDVKQGHLGDCWLMSAMSIVANTIPRLIEENIQYRAGKATMVLRNEQREEVAVVVDDTIPCDEKGPFFGKCADQNEFWVPIAEKAMAKLYGGYGKLDGGYTEEGIARLTGGIPERIYFANCPSNITCSRVHRTIDQLWQTMKWYYDHGIMMATSVSSKIDAEARKERGLYAYHGYAILHVRQVAEDVRLVCCRNPWGYFSWKGAWSPQSPEWQTEIAKSLPYYTPPLPPPPSSPAEVSTNANTTTTTTMTTSSSGDIGVFWMTIEDFFKEFDKIMACRLITHDWEQIKLDTVVAPGMTFCQELNEGHRYFLYVESVSEQDMEVKIGGDEALLTIEDVSKVQKGRHNSIGITVNATGKKYFSISVTEPATVHLFEFVEGTHGRT